MADPQGPAGRPAGVEPLYDQDDARKTIPLLKPVDYGKPTGVGSRRDACVFHDAGHILGSAFLELQLEGAGREGQGALQRRRRPARPADHPRSGDHRADRLPHHGVHLRRPAARRTTGSRRTSWRRSSEEAKRTGGNVIIPAFAVGRTQEILYFLREIFDETDLDMPVYVDSPLASRATEIFRRHREVFDEEAWKLVGEPGGIFDFPQLHYTASADESRALNEKKGVVIISASGMADAGRIRHHLKHNLWRPEAHVVIVGFQAQGTLGRRLLDGATERAHLRRRDRGEGPHPRSHRTLGPRRPGAVAGLGVAFQAASPASCHSRRAEGRAGRWPRLLEEKLHFTVAVPTERGPDTEPWSGYAGPIRGAHVRGDGPPAAGAWHGARRRR